MNKKLTITAGQVSQYLEGEESLQNVPWVISEGDSVLLEGNQSFPLTASSDEISEFLSRTLAVYKEDAARHEEAKARQEALDNASAVAGDITGMKLND